MNQYLHPSPPVMDSPNSSDAMVQAEIQFPSHEYQPLFQDDNQQDQYNDQDQNYSQLHIILRLPGHSSQLLPRPIQPRLMSINMSIYLIQHLNVLIQLIAYLNTQLPWS